MNNHGEDRDVESLVRLAGARPRLPDEEVAPVKAAARAAWRREVRRTRSRRRARLAFGGAALAAGLLFAVLGIFRSTAPPLAGTLAVQSGAVSVTGLQAGRGLEAGGVVATGAGGRAALRLAGGPSLRIDADSEVRLESARRVALVRGAVYVDADPAAAAGHDLVIATPFGSIEHLGTQFEARLQPASEMGPSGPAGALRVTVREGTVRLTLAGGAHTAGAGTALTVQPDGAVRRASAAPHGPAWDWVQRTAPPLDIEGATLTAFLDWTSREIGLPWLGAAGAGRQPADEVVLHGSIAGLTPTEALTVVLPSCGLRHRQTDRALVLELAGGGSTAPSGSRTTAAGPPS
jgi:hypothetical protein